MLQRLLSKITTQKGKTSKGKQSGQQIEMGVLLKSQNCHKDGRLKGRCKCEPTACKCNKRKQQQQQRSLLLSQLRRRGADNLSSVILF
ncbi:uncharacterized protein LOC117780318 isoform X2 [Drosophila innubila]|uniref:uncharacterized protein LOC117780318 isoform X2 n=1 Tax=Drosophila innubila TaxID=198719 RepID=UPI00148E8556|nr:uncharacterized protein LOC117780318 isoform X2 [Drosophila innubila]